MFHDLRPTFATTALQNDVDVKRFFHSGTLRRRVYPAHPHLYHAVKQGEVAHTAIFSLHLALGRP